MANDDQNILNVIIKNREKTLFEDKAKAVTSIDEKGTFDILPQHSNFISVIQKQVIVHKIDGAEEKFTCAEGVLRVESNVVRIYIDILPPEKV